MGNLSMRSLVAPFTVMSTVDEFEHRSQHGVSRIEHEESQASPPPPQTIINNTNNNQHQGGYATPPASTSAVDDDDNNSNTQNQQQQQRVVDHDYKEPPFDPSDQRPFIRRPFGKLMMPCGPRGPKFTAPWPWIWMLPIELVPLTVFLILVPPPEEIWSRVIACLLVAISLTVMFLANCVDPSIVYCARVGDPEPSSKIIHIDEVGEVELEVCKTCKIVRPPRSSHCRTADVCVRDYDHFCGVINSVVAQKTFRWFTWFMWATFLLVVFVGARCIYAVTKEYDYDHLFGSGYGRFRIIGTYLLIIFLCGAGLATMSTGWIYCFYAGKDLTLKDLKGRKQFRNTRAAFWTCHAMFIRLCSCDHYDESFMNENMTWIEEDPESGEKKIMGFNV